MLCVLFGSVGVDILIPIEVYSVYIRGPPIQSLGMEQIFGWEQWKRDPEAMMLHAHSPGFALTTIK